MMRKWQSLAALVVLTWLMSVQLVQANEPTVHGFALEKIDLQTGKCSPHVRLVLGAELGQKLDLSVSLSPVGPMPLGSYYSLTWRNPVAHVESVEIGRQFPRFGGEWYGYRVDSVPMLNYASCYRPLAAIDTGVSLTGREGGLFWYAGMFARDRVFGNALAWRGGPDSYFQLGYQTRDLSLKLSQRLGLVSATGADALLRLGRTRLTLEGVSSKGVTEGFAQAEYQLSPRFALAGRHEWLQSGVRWGAALTYQVRKDFEVKLMSQTGPSQLLGQGTLRF